MDNILKIVHAFAWIIFLGNIITEIRWMYKASKTGSSEAVRFTITEVIKGDRVFTLPGVLLITITGNFMYSSFSLTENRWLLYVLAAYILSGLIYTLRVAPLQKKIAKIVSDPSHLPSGDYTKAYASWNFWGWIAFLAAAAALALTIAKLPL